MTRGLEIPKFSRSPSPTASSTAWRPRRRRSSRIRCQRRWRRAGVAVRPRSSSARTPLSSRHSRTRHRQRTRGNRARPTEAPDGASTGCASEPKGTARGRSRADRRLTPTDLNEAAHETTRSSIPHSGSPSLASWRPRPARPTNSISTPGRTRRADPVPGDPGKHHRHTGRHAVRGQRRHRRDPALSARLTTAETLVPAGVNAGTVGVFAATRRGVLWACAVDLTFQNPTALRAFDLRTGALRASYQLPDRGVCTDIALAHGDVTSPIPRIRPRARACRDGSCG